ncbi:MAG: protein phosphatase 2C domain-containing protein [Acidobacteriota bacterium]
MLTAHGVTHAGRVRKTNEDALTWDPDLGVFIVADGMGGHNAGDVASKLAVESIRSFLERSRGGDDVTWPFGINPTLSFPGNRLMTAVKLANRRVFKTGESRDEYTGLGTTIVAALVEDGQLMYSGVGDSRIYSFVDGRLEQLTQDDSWVATVLAREPGTDETLLASHPMRHVLTNVLGAREHLDVEVGERPLTPGETLLFCSDGLHGTLDDAMLAHVLASGRPVDVVAEALLERALAGDASDNITALVVRFDA